MQSLPAERKALLFSAGGERFALRVSHLREIVAIPEGEGEVTWRGEVVPTAFVSTVLGLTAGPSRFALLTEGNPRAALRVEALHGIADLADAEVFKLPARTFLPQPPPFAGAVVVDGNIALELRASALGFAPLAPAVDHTYALADVDPGTERELRFARGGRVFGVPLSLLVQILEAPRVAPVPLAPPSHRGVLYHGRTLHPVLDVGVVYGDSPDSPVRMAILLDAGGAGAGVVADRVLGPGESATNVVRPPWDTLFAP